MTHLDGGSTLFCYEQYLSRRYLSDPEFRKRLVDLEDKVLGCFCKPNPCHGDYLIVIVEQNKQRRLLEQQTKEYYEY